MADWEGCALMWTDLFIDRIVDDGALTRGLARVFAIGGTDVGIVDSITAASAERIRSLPIRVERAPDTGDFPLRVSIFLDYDLQPRIENSADEQAVIAMLCALWQCSCLFSDD